MELQTHILGYEGNVYARLIRGGVSAATGQEGEFGVTAEFATEMKPNGKSVVSEIKVEYPFDMGWAAGNFNATGSIDKEPKISNKYTIEPPLELDDDQDTAIKHTVEMTRYFGGGVLGIVDAVKEDPVATLTQSANHFAVDGQELKRALNRSYGGNTSDG